ncbi:hypothetical protein A3D03_00350 [Candidatus Gottesmanbacteria bacterium RIFCSPHIGHO2_02_FULL_40_13]|uniref:PIN domain-containing protein n=1 Tax=Candidatus Gottesmanbacteria bacterium RIFCSPHIGHO2_02_FULL_40_13 TaxID=1798384 RepID=A0A1F6A558_9BACT|nr:MAG: hypothetical protein A3D03_00350 [Candidatus Gottesmanbacteria bacterium RIFCSPHIGHO2_02_FULL_40_13]
MEKNNRFLLDTHIFIWWMKQEKRLKKEIETVLKNPENQIFLSVASVLEIVIKKKIGKLKVPQDWKVDLRESSFLLLPISLENAFQLESLPLFHHDPFDRMLIAQTKVEGATLITGDEKIWKYDIPILKA